MYTINVEFNCFGLTLFKSLIINDLYLVSFRFPLYTTTFLN